MSLAFVILVIAANSLLCWVLVQNGFKLGWAKVFQPDAVNWRLVETMANVQLACVLLLESWLHARGVPQEPASLSLDCWAVALFSAYVLSRSIYVLAQR